MFESPPMSSSSYEKKYVEDLTLKPFLFFEIGARKRRGKFVYKHSGTKEYVKN